MDKDKIQAHKDKLKAEAEKREHKQELQEAINATKDSTNAVIGAIAGEAQRTRQHTQKVEVTNPTKVEVEHTIDFKPMLESLAEVKKAVSKVAKDIKIPKNEKTEEVSVNNLKDYTDKLDEAIEAIKAIELSPSIQVQAPKVTTPKLDLKPLIDALEKEKEVDVEIDLEDFRAQDINNEEIGIQYIGFVHPSGAWYIIKNFVDEDKMRYKFGKSDYEKFFAAPDTYEYATLDRAIYEIQT